MSDPEAPRPGPPPPGRPDSPADSAVPAGVATPGAVSTGAVSTGAVSTGHPAVDAALHAMANATNLPPADQIAQYEAAHRTLQETLSTIDES